MSLKERLSSGKIANGIMLSELYTPNIIRILKNCGYDFVLVDCEHGYFDLTQIANIAAIADGIDMPVIIRATHNSKDDIAKYLDMGAQGILMSNVTSIEQARELVDLCLYAPLGDRGVSTFRAHTGYQNGNVKEILANANKRIIVIAQIESPEGSVLVDDIFDLNGIDGVLIGPNDLTQHMQMLGNYTDPAVIQILEHITASAKKHSKWTGIITENTELLTKCHELGMTCFSSGSELNALRNGAIENLKKLKAIENINI